MANGATRQTDTARTSITEIGYGERKRDTCEHTQLKVGS